MISTPYGLNHFYKIWHDSEQGLNDFVRVEGKWNESRSPEWFATQAKLLGDPVKVAQELECVGANTVVRVKDSKTNKIFETTIAKLYQELLSDPSR